MRENRTSGSEGGEAQTNELSLPLHLEWNLFCRKLLLRKGFCGLFLATVRVERVY